MARSTYGVYLMYKSTDTATEYTKLCDIKSYPDLGGSPERLDATTLSDGMRVYIEGIQDTEEMTFDANYDKAKYSTIKALEGKVVPTAVYFGHDSTGSPDGSDGKFTWNGTINVHVTGGQVNEVAGMQITCTPNTVITMES